MMRVVKMSTLMVEAGQSDEKPFGCCLVRVPTTIGTKEQWQWGFR
jgi:hypothetical protein